MEWPAITAEPLPEEQEWRQLRLAGRRLRRGRGSRASPGQHSCTARNGSPRGCMRSALVAGGWDAAIDTWANLRSGEIDIHFLMLAVAIGAVFIGAWGEAVLLLFLFSAVGRDGGIFARPHPARGRRAPQERAQARDAGAAGRRPSAKSPVEDLRVGQRVRVKPGEAFSADGMVVTGRSASDESALTGEAQPVPKASATRSSAARSICGARSTST